MQVKPKVQSFFLSMKIFKYLFASRRMDFDQAGFFIIGLMIIVWFGFGPSYFERLAGNEFTFYIHFHAVNMVIWLLTIFVQPILIRQGKLSSHKLIGRITYFFFPIVIFSMILLIHSQMNASSQISGGDFFVPFKDVVTMSIYYSLGIFWRKNIAIHSRFMVAAFIPLIEPALVRMLLHSLPSTIVEYAYPLTVSIIDILILLLVLRDFRKLKLRWIFISLFLIMLSYQLVIFSGLTESTLIFTIARWFAALPLT